METTHPSSPQHEPNYVLIVDDDEAVLAMTKAILEAIGFAPITATSGEQAIEIYSQGLENGYPTPVVLLDLTLPGGISGVETMQQLTQLDPHVRAIATSGYFDEHASETAKRLGFLGILPKPFTIERLKKMMQWTASKAAA